MAEKQQLSAMLLELHARCPTLCPAVVPAGCDDRESGTAMLALSRDAPIETRAHAHADLCDRAAGVALRLFDARTLVNEASAAQRVVPQRALSELLVAQLAYHQSCTSMLTSVMPNVSTLLSCAEEASTALEAEKEASKQVRNAMPQPTIGKTNAASRAAKGAALRAALKATIAEASIAEESETKENSAMAVE